LQSALAEGQLQALLSVRLAGRPSGLLPVSAITVATLIIMDGTSVAFTDGWHGRHVGLKN
jgi:hypothetical protein